MIIIKKEIKLKWRFKLKSPFKNRPTSNVLFGVLKLTFIIFSRFVTNRIVKDLMREESGRVGKVWKAD